MMMMMVTMIVTMMMMIMMMMMMMVVVVVMMMMMIFLGNELSHEQAFHLPPVSGWQLGRHDCKTRPHAKASKRGKAPHSRRCCGEA